MIHVKSTLYDGCIHRIILNLNTNCTAGESEHELGFTLCINMNRLILVQPKMLCSEYLIGNYVLARPRTREHGIDNTYQRVAWWPSSSMHWCRSWTRMSGCKAYLISLWPTHNATMGVDSWVWQPHCSKFQHAQHAPMHAPVLQIYIHLIYII